MTLKTIIRSNYRLLALLITMLITINTSISEEITICRANNMVSALPYIAEAKGFYKAHGIDPKFETATNAKICQDMLVAKKADYMTGAEGPFTYLAASKPDIKILAMLGQDPETAIFARCDHGISNFKDLENKKIAYLPGTVSFFFLSRVIKKYQLSNYKLNSMQPPTMPAALIGGAVDAISIWEPWGSQAINKIPDKVIILKDTKMYQFESLLFGRGEYVNQHPETTKNILLAMIDAENFIKEQNEQAFEILKNAISFEQNSFRKIWPEYTFKVKIENFAIELMQENFKLLKEYDENFKNIEQPDYKSFVDSTYLKSISKSRVEF